MGACEKPRPTRVRAEDPKKWTQAALAKVFGVDRSTVAKWFPPNGSNVNVHNTSADAAFMAGGEEPERSRPDARTHEGTKC